MARTISRRLFAAGTLVIPTQAFGLPARAGNTTQLIWQSIDGGQNQPAPRWDHTIAASDERKVLLVFGGRDANGASRSDSWLFERPSGRWEAVDLAGPSPRFGHAVATDQTGNLMYLFGGQSADVFYNDLWQFDFETGAWALVHDGSGNAPVPRYGTSLVWTDRGTLLLSHGFTFSGRFNDTWEFDPAAATWSDLSPESESDRPLNRCLHESVWDPSRQAMLLYGGCSSGYGPCPQGDLWSFDPGTRAWTQFDATGAPAARSNPALVYDGGRRQSILIGGLTESGYDDGTWRLDSADPSEWVPIRSTEPAPIARASHDCVTTGPNLYLFGGYTADGASNELWHANLVN